MLKSLLLAVWEEAVLLLALMVATSRCRRWGEELSISRAAFHRLWRLRDCNHPVEFSLEETWWKFEGGIKASVIAVRRQDESNSVAMRGHVNLLHLILSPIPNNQIQTHVFHPAQKETSALKNAPVRSEIQSMDSSTASCRSSET